ncbi:tryptophan synthase subunit alpha [Oceanospirillaceae bacterium]|jgi:tryptophan synthase alpha chain|nr:tryptophan synthase subunit alpha [Oceanospirillaceae bacterium]MDC1340725.1 tryptophan synthase subunit alpha [Oceanospirillaceae bacterium]|tara:strand:+ start:867 stop:1676 length:810 start_codon:yes stop_codon:yes gene_type:complete
MSRIEACFSALKAQGRQALIPYVTAGDPNPQVTVGLMHQMVSVGADLIELGIPFSDPMADGPVIQLACERALSHNTSLAMILAMVAEFRQDNSTTPVVLMGYLNTVEKMGYDVFVAAAKEVDLDGVLLVDLPPEESADFAKNLRQAGLDAIFLITPTTTEERIKKICAVGSGYLYYVSLKGVTGGASIDTVAVEQKLDLVKQHTKLPLGVGFGIKDAASAARVSQIADGVVVGSVLVNALGDNANDPAKGCAQVVATLSEMRQAMDAAV